MMTSEYPRELGGWTDSLSEHLPQPSLRILYSSHFLSIGHKKNEPGSPPDEEDGRERQREEETRLLCICIASAFWQKGRKRDDLSPFSSENRIALCTAAFAA